MRITNEGKVDTIAKDKVGGMDKWLRTYAQLVVLEFVLSAIFLPLSYIFGSQYFRGVGIGLVIAWATGAIAYFVVSRRA
jgi:hypothetical protein